MLSSIEASETKNLKNIMSEIGQSSF
jgi:hypothetical protein